MKKLMMAAAIVCAVCSVKAASVSWTAYQYAGDEATDFGYFVDAKGNPYAAMPANTEIWLCLMATDGTTVDTELNQGALQEDGSIAGTYEFEYSSKLISNNDVLKVLIKDTTTGKYSDPVAAANAEGNDPTTFASYTVSGLSDDSWDGGEFVFATGNFTTAAVPEPTSGLLLLVGGALLALRRRRA